MPWKMPLTETQNHESDGVLGYTDTTFVNRNAKLQIARQAGLIPSSPAITPALHVIQQSHGDNSGYKPGVGVYAQARDDAAVLTDSDRGVLIAAMFEVVPLRARSNSPADDANALMLANASDNASKGSDAIYIAQGSAFGTAHSFITGAQVAAYTDFDFFSGHPPGGAGSSGTGLELRKSYSNYGIDAKLGTFTGGVLRLPNNQNGIVARNQADGADLNVLNVDTNNRINIGGSAGSAALRVTVSGTGNVVVGTGALATGATTGFLHIPTCAGTPSGTPTIVSTGVTPFIYDSTGKKWWVWDAPSSSWKGVVVA